MIYRNEIINSYYSLNLIFTQRIQSEGSLTLSFLIPSLQNFETVKEIVMENLEGKHFQRKSFDVKSGDKGESENYSGNENEKYQLLMSCRHPSNDNEIKG